MVLLLDGTEGLGIAGNKLMAAHLYSAFWTKMVWFQRRFGASEIVLKPLRLAFAPLILQCLRRHAFQWEGEELQCFYHRYNMTWAGERAAEIPIAKKFLDAAAGKTVLEVGNVLPHYFATNHTIVDKFEVAPGVINQDILDYRPETQFDLILSISTFEHIGFDDDSEGGSGKKIVNGVKHCRSLLSPAGRLVLTVPLGYNPELDGLIRTNDWEAAAGRYLYRTGFTQWQECDQSTAFTHPYRSRFPYGNAIMIAEFLRLV